jgi:hypothetical protein
MKTLINIILILFLGFSTYAQSFNYQTIVRSSSGAPQANTLVNLRFTILETEVGGVLYREVQNPTTDQYGWLSITVGQGTPVSGIFANVDFTMERFLLVECSSDGGANYGEIGISKINNGWSNGTPGPKGDKGDKGDMGSVGPKGDKGDNGAVGPKGDKGDDGMIGSKGDTGAKGDQGEPGVAGQKGDKGDTGLIGPKGDKGDTGQQGIKGDAGESSLPVVFKMNVAEPIGDYLNATDYPLKYTNLEIIEGGGSYNATTGEYTIPHSGVYSINADFNFDFVNSTQGMILVFKVAKNGFVENVKAIQRTIINESYSELFQCSYLATFSAGDRVKFSINNIWGVAPSPGPITSSSISIAKIGGSGGVGSGSSSDNQILTLMEDGTLSIQRGNSVVIDADPSNEIQALSIAGNQLSLSNGGGTVTLPSGGGSGTTYTAGSGIDITGTTISAVDNSTTNEIQTLSLAGNLLSLSNGGGNVTLTPSTDNQNLSISGNQLTISNGNTVTLPGTSGGSFTLPYTGTYRSTGVSTDGFYITNTGSSRAARFRVNNPLSTAPAVLAETNGGYYAADFFSNGTAGGAGIFEIANAANNAPSLDAKTSGTGFAIRATSSNPAKKALFTSGQVQLSGISEGAGKVLTSDADGFATWQTPASSASQLWESSATNSDLVQNVGSVNQVLISPEPESFEIAGNTPLVVGTQSADKVAEFITTNTTSGTKAVSIVNQGTATEFVNPTSLYIENQPFLDSGNGIEVRAGGTGIKVEGTLQGIVVNSSNLGAAGSFTGGTGLIGSGQNTGVNGSAAFASHNSAGLRGTYTGNGSFDATGVEGLSLPANATIPNGRGFGIGGKFKGGNKGIIAEMDDNPTSTYLTDLVLHTKIYGNDNLPMAGIFKSKSSIGISSTSTDSHNTLAGDAYSIGVVGRSNASGTSVKNIGVYGEGEGAGERIGIMGHAEATATNLSVGVRGTAAGVLGVGGEFKAAEGIHVEGSTIGLYVQAPTNELSGGSTTQAILKLQHASVAGGTALELQNGYIKVNQSSNAKTAYKHLTAASNLAGNATILNFANQKASDIIMITRGLPFINRNISFYTWYDNALNKWKISTDDASSMPSGWEFSVLVIKTE